MKLKKSGWGGELEIKAMSKMFDVEFEIWIPDRTLGAATQPQYYEGKDRMALAYYPGVHYDYLRKLKVKEASIAPSPMSDVDTTSKVANVEASSKDESPPHEKDPKIRKIETDTSRRSDQASGGMSTTERTDNMTLDELLIAPSMTTGNELLIKQGGFNTKAPSIGDIGLRLDEANLNESSSPTSDNNGIDIGNVKNMPGQVPSDGDSGNHARVDSEVSQTRNPTSLPDDPSLGNSRNDEGSALNVNQKATGPK